MVFLPTAIVSSLLAGLLLLSGRGKLVQDPAQMKTLAMVGVPERCAVWLAAAEIAGAVGLIAGLFWWPVGVAASAGIIGYFLGATGSHLRVRDWHVTAPLILLLTGIGTLVLRIASH